MLKGHQDQFSKVPSVFALRRKQIRSNSWAPSKRGHLHLDSETQAVQQVIWRLVQSDVILHSLHQEPRPQPSQNGLALSVYFSGCEAKD